MMNDEAKTRLAKILGDYDAKLAETERVATATRAAHAAFPERFLAFKNETLRPALDEVAALLNEHGHEAKVKEQEESSGASGGVVHFATISLRVVPKPFAHKATEPSQSAVEVTFSANRSERKVTVSSTNTMVGNAGSVGKRGEYAIDSVTADIIANHVIQTLHEAFGAAR
jgi:hypothetical protein